MSNNKNFNVEVLSHTDLEKFKTASKLWLDKGYHLAASNDCFDNQGEQHYYAVFHYEVSTPIEQNFVDSLRTAED